MKNKFLFLLLYIGIFQLTYSQTFSSGGINYEIIPSTTTVKIVRTNPISGAVSIPTSVNYNSQAYSVTEISDASFYGEGITSIVIPSTVTIIGGDAFNGCQNLTSVSIPNSVTSIGNYAFSFCTSLTSITIPESITFIGSAAFGNCTSLTMVICKAILPPPIYADTFNGLNLSTLTLTIPIISSIQTYQSDPLWGLFGTVNTFGSVNTTTVSACVSINGYTWSNTGMSYYNSGIYNGTETNGVYEQLNLTFVDNFTVNTINYSVLSPSTVAVDVTNNVSGDVIIPASITTSCGTYEVTRINDNAFAGNTGLTSVIIPNTVTQIRNSAFEGCSALTSVTIPNSVTRIRSAAFADCTSLNSVTIPNSITQIDDETFSGCTSLTFITIPNSVVEIGDEAFEGCTSLTSITLPNSVTDINYAAFSNSGLTSVTIPQSVSYIGSSAFINCTSLTSVTIPESVSSIEDETFSGCTSLTSVIIPNSVTDIYYAAFAGCTNLTSVTIPQSVSYISSFAFADTSLTSIICNVTIPIVITSDVFDNVDQSACTLTVPAGSVAAYQAASVWEDFNITSVSSSNVWTGTTNSSWSTASNWSLNAVPTTSDDIVISSGTNAPILDVDITIPVGKSLTISGTGTLTIAPGKTLTIAGSADFGGKAVTFKSDATGTAMLGTLTGTLTGASNVTVERFIPSGKRAFRLLSPAVTTTNFISGNWQQQTHITGGASGGFDATETNNPSMFTYNNNASSGSGWTAIANTNATNLTAGVGYRILVRGDRTASNITAASADSMNTAVTLSATGTLRTGTVTLNSSSTPSINNTSNTTTADYSLVGNPYQSAVDWNAVTKSGIDATYWAWDPNMGTTAQRGRYVSFNGTVNNVDGGVGSSNVGQFIQPGQAFFVKNTVSGTAGTLTFQEAHKATTNANVFRTANPTTLTVSLYDPNELAIGGYPIDATKAVFSAEYTNELGLGDAAKLEAAGENIAWFRNNAKLAIEAAAPVTASDELVMKTIRLGANKNYTFKINTTNFDADLTPYLVDNFLNTQTQISTSEVYLANFSTTSNVASYGEDRFKIVFQNRILDTDDFANNIKLYPNPAKAGTSFYIDGITEATVSVYNVVGQNIPVTVMSQGNATQVTPKTALSQGVYLVTITTAGKTAQVKWIVE